jgi:hypothetical protein
MLLYKYYINSIYRASQKMGDMEKWSFWFYLSAFQWFPTNEFYGLYKFRSLWLFWVYNIFWKLILDRDMACQICWSGMITVFALITSVMFYLNNKTLRAKEIINMKTLIRVYTCNSLVRGKIKGRTAANKQANTAVLSRADSEQTYVIINNTSELTCLTSQILI